MYKHILLPTDGSEISTRLTRQCLAYAKESGASVIGIHVLSTMRSPLHQPEPQDYNRKQYEHECATRGRLCLAEVVEQARELGVPCETVLLHDDEPHRAILQVAYQHGCDLICIATHSHGGIKPLMLGSVTLQVLLNSKIPVLVMR